MDRRACVDVPALALQLLLAAHPEWRALPMAVVDADEPTGTLLWVNAAAWRAGLRSGMRYASALSIEARLRAGTVAAATIAAAVADITTVMRSHTPHVEPSREEAGVFWLDAGGLESLYTSVEAWGQAVARAIRARGFEARLVVGFKRFGTYALARTLGSATDAAPRTSRRAGLPARRVLLCESEEEERRLVEGVVLERLGIAPKLRDALARLGVRTVGDFLRLPAEGIRRRFGEEASHLHRRARGDAWDPLVPLAPEPSRKRSLLLDDPVFDTGIVLFVVRRLLAELVAPLAEREQGACAVVVTLHRSLRRDVPAVTLAVRAAEPTLDEAALADLVRLRLESEMRRALAGASIVEIDVEIETAAAGREQLRLFHERTRRDLAAGARALARVRAELGENSVVRAVLRQGHLPEATYTWEPADALVAASPRLVLLRPLVRRIHEHAAALPPKPFRERDDGWIPAATESPRPVENRTAARGHSRTAHGRVDHMTGPYIVSGGWWNREVHREYHYARTEDGEILWVYYDRRRRRWYLAGQVE
ncbi:MAG: DNA polymerase Y family protein [Candidatus Binatia bacterium]